jgi:hypothetical protein
VIAPSGTSLSRAENGLAAAGVWNNAAYWHILPAFNQAEETNMLKSGVSMFFTDYSMAPGALGIALEKRGFESVWAPEHSHIPLSRKSPFPNGGELPKRYYDAKLGADEFRGGDETDGAGVLLPSDFIPLA